MVTHKQVISKRTGFVLQGKVKRKTGLLVTDNLRFSADISMENLSEKEVALAGN